MIGSRRGLSVAFCIGIGVIVLIGLLLPSKNFLEVMRGGLLSVSIGLATAFWPLAKMAVVDPQAPLPEGAVLGVGWFLLSGATAAWATFYLLWRSVGSPDLWWDEYLLGFISYVEVFGAILVLVVPRSHRGLVPPRALMHLGLKTSVGVALVLLTLTVMRWLGLAS